MPLLLLLIPIQHCYMSEEGIKTALAASREKKERKPKPKGKPRPKTFRGNGFKMVIEYTRKGVPLDAIECLEPVLSELRKSVETSGSSARKIAA